MEDGTFLGRVISEVVRGVISTREAVHVYEKQRIPRVWIKQQAAFINGRMNTLSGTEQLQRDRASVPEVAAFDRNPLHSEPLPATYRPWQLFSSAETVPGILAYDAEADADFAVCEYLQNKGEIDPKTMVSKGLYDKWWNTMHNNGIARCTL
jgi:salicylate hydroxylase